MVFGELCMKFHRIRAYPYHLSLQLPELLVGIPKGPAFLGATRGLVLGIEVEDHGFLAYKVFKAYLLSPFGRRM